MFFVAGTRADEQRVGEVVDSCPSCRTLAFASIVEHRSRWHVYFIPLGKGSVVGVEQRCSSCGASFAHDPSRFAEMLPPGSAGELSLEAALRRTRPELAVLLERARGVAQRAETPPYRNADDERDAERLRDAAAQLEQLVRSGDAIGAQALLARFEGWSTLPRSARDELLGELRGYARAAGRSRR